MNGQIVVVRTILFSAIFNFAFHLFQSLMLLFGSLQKSITAVCLFRRSLCESRWLYLFIYMIIINYLRKSFLSAAGFSSNYFVTKMTYHGSGKLLQEVHPRLFFYPVTVFSAGGSFLVELPVTIFLCESLGLYKFGIPVLLVLTGCFIKCKSLLLARSSLFSTSLSQREHARIFQMFSPPQF
jgi:hypothetical protein